MRLFIFDLPVVALLVSEGVASLHHQKLVGGGVQNRDLNAIFKREDGRRASNARSAVGSALYIHHPDGRLRQDRTALAVRRGRASHSFLPAGRPSPVAIQRA